RAPIVKDIPEVEPADDEAGEPRRPENIIDPGDARKDLDDELAREFPEGTPAEVGSLGQLLFICKRSNMGKTIGIIVLCGLAFFGLFPLLGFCANFVGLLSGRGTGAVPPLLLALGISLMFGLGMVAGGIGGAIYLWRTWKPQRAL